MLNDMAMRSMPDETQPHYIWFVSDVGYPVDVAALRRMLAVESRVAFVMLLFAMST